MTIRDLSQFGPGSRAGDRGSKGNFQDVLTQVSWSGVVWYSMVQYSMVQYTDLQATPAPTVLCHSSIEATVYSAVACRGCIRYGSLVHWLGLTLRIAMTMDGLQIDDGNES